jgi:hypothetical protein
VIATRRDGRQRIDDMLDLQSVPSGERWGQIQRAVRRLDDARGRDWRLKVLLADTPEEAGALPPLVVRLRLAGLQHDAVREPGGIQGMVITPARAEEALLVAA